METTCVLFFDKCRLCLLEVGITNILNQELAQDIFTFTGVMVKKTDNLPLNICTKCLEVIEKAKDLREVAMNNDKLLCSLFGVKEEDIKLDSKFTEYKATEKSARDESLGSEKKYVHHQFEKSTSTSSNHHIKIQEKKKKISIRKDLFETSKAVRCSTNVEEKKDEKPPKHKMVKNSDGQEEYICGICNKTYITLKKLYLHNRLHDKKYICPLDACGKKFATKGDLEKHKRTHTGVKPYVCDICNKSFSQQGTLKVHKEKVHYCFTFS